MGKKVEQAKKIIKEVLIKSEKIYKENAPKAKKLIDTIEKSYPAVKTKVNHLVEAIGNEKLKTRVKAVTDFADNLHGKIPEARAIYKKGQVVAPQIRDIFERSHAIVAY